MLTPTQIALIAKGYPQEKVAGLGSTVATTVGYHLPFIGEALSARDTARSAGHLRHALVNRDYSRALASGAGVLGNGLMPAAGLLTFGKAPRAIRALGSIGKWGRRARGAVKGLPAGQRILNIIGKNKKLFNNISDSSWGALHSLGKNTFGRNKTISKLVNRFPNGSYYVPQLGGFGIGQVEAGALGKYNYIQ